VRTIEYRPLGDVLPAKRNPKAHADDDLDASFARFGVIEPTVLDERTGRLISGHGRLDRLKAAEAAGERPPDGITVVDGVWQLPVVRGWRSRNDAEARAALIAVNRIGERGGWMVADLADMLDDLRAGPGLDGIGYTSAGLDDMLASLVPAPAPPDPPAPPKPTRPRTKVGDVWLLGQHRLVCGDCRDPSVVEAAVAGRRVAIAVTSPPYAEQRDYDKTSGFTPIPPDEYVEWFAPVAANVAAVLADDGSWFVNIKPPGRDLDTDLYVMDLVIAHVREWGWHFLTEFCWERTGVPKQVVHRFKNQFEPVYQFVRGRPKVRPDNVRHPTDDAIIPFGPGRGNTSWADPDSAVVSQGQSGDLFDGQRARRKGRGNTSWKGRQGHTSALPDDIRPRRRKHGVPGAGTSEAHQGTGHNDVGEFKTVGLAYPGNRLPTFAGTHTATGHPAAFPVGLPAWFIRAYTDVGDVILDPFVGSGSTIIAAAQQSRVGIGIEASRGYCDVVCARYQATFGDRPVLERTSKAHDFPLPS